MCGTQAAKDKTVGAAYSAKDKTVGAAYSAKDKAGDAAHAVSHKAHSLTHHSKDAGRDVSKCVRWPPRPCMRALRLLRVCGWPAQLE